MPPASAVLHKQEDWQAKMDNPRDVANCGMTRAPAVLLLYCMSTVLQDTSDALNAS